MIAKFRPVALALMSLPLYAGVISGQGEDIKKLIKQFKDKAKAQS